MNLDVRTENDTTHRMLSENVEIDKRCLSGLKAHLISLLSNTLRLRDSYSKFSTF